MALVIDLQLDSLLRCALGVKKENRAQNSSATRWQHLTKLAPGIQTQATKEAVELGMSVRHVITLQYHCHSKTLPIFYPPLISFICSICN